MPPASASEGPGPVEAVPVVPENVSEKKGGLKSFFGLSKRKQTQMKQTQEVAQRDKYEEVTKAAPIAMLQASARLRAHCLAGSAGPVYLLLHNQQQCLVLIFFGGMAVLALRRLLFYMQSLAIYKVVCALTGNTACIIHTSIHSSSLDTSSPGRSQSSNGSSFPLVQEIEEEGRQDMTAVVAEPPRVLSSLVQHPNFTELQNHLKLVLPDNDDRGIDLSLLTACLCPFEAVQEGEEEWTPDQLFTDVASEIHADMEKAEAKQQRGVDETT